MERNRKNRNSPCWRWLAKLITVFALLLLAGACQKEAIGEATETEKGLPATIRLDVMPEPTAQTRAVDENTIKDLHVLVYNKRGELIGKNYTTGSTTLTVNTRSGSGYTLYAIANTEDATLFDGTVAATEELLKAMKTTELTAWDALGTSEHLLMAGSKANVTVQAGSNTLQGGMEVSRLAGKVTLNIGVKAGSGITITNYQVISLPTQSFYTANVVEKIATDGATKWMDGPLTAVNAASANGSFFMYENLKGVVKDIEKQRDKGGDKVPKNATYVVINGFTDDFTATWRVYLGKNNTDNFNVERNSMYTYTITLSVPGADGVDTRVSQTIPGEKSNSYIVKPGNAVTIPVERANESFIELENSTLHNGTYSQLSSGTTWYAEIVWESSAGLISLSDATGTGPTGRFKVTTTHASTGGNAVVAIQSGGIILWSWHIWVTTYDGTTTWTHHNGKRTLAFMDRALGATSATPGELSSCGLMYQWGRKDPFPGIGQQGGSWSIQDNADPIYVFNNKGTAYEIDTIAVPTTATPNNLTNATRNPDRFYYNTVSPCDWFVTSGSSQNDNLWSGGNIAATAPAPKSVFDPCPAGWRIAPWLDGTSPFAEMENGSTWSAAQYGCTWQGTGGYFPASGARGSISGGVFDVSTKGYCWSGSPGSVNNSTNGSILYFNSGKVFPVFYSYRASGFPVRCCTDDL